MFFVKKKKTRSGDELNAKPAEQSHQKLLPSQLDDAAVARLRADSVRQPSPRLGHCNALMEPHQGVEIAVCSADE